MFVIYSFKLSSGYHVCINTIFVSAVKTRLIMVENEQRYYVNYLFYNCNLGIVKKLNLLKYHYENPFGANIKTYHISSVNAEYIKFYTCPGILNPWSTASFVNLICIVYYFLLVTSYVK